MACSSNNATKQNPDLSLSHLCKLRERDDLGQKLEEYSAEEILSRGPCVPAHLLEVTSRLSQSATLAEARFFILAT